MNRPLIVALILAFSPVAAMAQVTEDPAAKQKRIDQYQDRRLILDEGKNPGKSPEPGATPVPLILRQGPDQIYQVDFVQLMNDPSLDAYWARERNKDWAIWIGSGAVGLPAGAALFLLNFKGEGPLAPYGSSPDAARAASAGDLRAYALSVLGAGIALYGAYNLGLWLAESLDLHHPERLDRAAIDPRVRTFNETLRERLNLDPADIPSPPTPRPPPSPSRTPNGDDDAESILRPSPTVDGIDSNPYGASTAPLLQTPLPLAEPGVLPSALVPTPEPLRPSVFKLYPGTGGYPVPSQRPNLAPSASPTPAGLPTP